jgi:hypothetical protein
MGKIVGLVLVIATAASAVTHAQETVNSARLLSDARETLRIYAEDARNRQAEVSRKVQVLRTLGEAADSISSFSTSLSLEKARGKLADARRLAETDPQLSEPVSSVLAAVDELINRPGMG